jgi:hypothetical protein
MWIKRSPWGQLQNLPISKPARSFDQADPSVTL